MSVASALARQAKNRQAVYDYVTAYTHRNGMNPTAIDVARALGCSHITAERHMMALSGAGQIQATGWVAKKTPSYVRKLKAAQVAAHAALVKRGLK